MTDPRLSQPLDPDGDVSVVIVAYRTPDVLIRCLESFEEHQPQRVGAVIVIDNSADGSGRTVAERFGWIDYVEEPDNLHFRGGCNAGARRARLRYVLFLNPDAYLTDPTATAQLADVLDARTDVGFVGPKLEGDDGGLAPQGEPAAGLRHLIVDRTGVARAWPRLARRTRPANAVRHEPGPVETVTAAALMCRRDEFLAVGGFDERVRMYWEEHELSRKYASRGHRGWYEPRAFMFHSWRKGGSELDPAVTAYFEEAASHYYSTFFGARGTITYRALAAARRLAKSVVR